MARCRPLSSWSTALFDIKVYDAETKRSEKIELAVA
jgi:hypothetical protein